MNTTELKKDMLDHGDTNKSLAAFLGMAESTFCSKLHEKGASFRKREMQAIIDRYSYTPDRIKAVFFAD